MPVERGLGHARPSGHLVEGDALDAAVEEEVDGGVERRLPRLFATGSCHRYAIVVESARHEPCDTRHAANLLAQAPYVPTRCRSDIRRRPVPEPPACTTTPPSTPAASQILVVLCISLMIVIIGNTALNVALPRLALDLDASTTDLQWMVDAYSLVFAGMLFTAGTLGDRFGRKGALQAGLRPVPGRHACWPPSATPRPRSSAPGP